MEPKVTVNKPGNPWLGFAILIILPTAIPVNVLLWRLAVG